MKCEIEKLNSLSNYKFVVIITKYQDKLIFCKHRERTTWEFPGGHIEPSEIPLAVAKRELYEETGAVYFEIESLFDYSVTHNEESSTGVVFFANITELGELPNTEIERIERFEEIPSNMTYPQIQPLLYKAYQNQLKSEEKQR